MPFGKRTPCLSAALGALVAACAVGAPPALAQGDEQVVRTERVHGHTLTVATHVDTRAELAQAATSAPRAATRQGVRLPSGTLFSSARTPAFAT